jgi:hypothetical protein
VERIRLALRRLALAGSGLTFGVIALLSLVAPRAVAERYAYALSGADSANEFHAVFTGFWIGLAVLMITAARRPEDRRLGDLCGLAIGLQATARLVSCVMHGMPTPSFVSAMIGEGITAILILQGRSVTPPA